MKKVLVLGASGSIGANTLEIIENNKDSFELVGFSCGNNLDQARLIHKKFPKAKIAVQAENNDGFPHGDQAIIDLINESDADIAVNAIAGAAGLIPSTKVIENGMDLALANKETIVTSGKFIFDLAKKHGVKILPVDSEHYAVFDLSHGRDKSEIDKIILTASGGAFRDFPLEEMHNVTVEQALKHPTWDMGKKITIDSATMANKGLEVIEAVYLFEKSAKDVQVLIHPDSLVHSLIKTIDGYYYAQISMPDMKHPILNALTYPCRKSNICQDLDLTTVNLQFHKPDFAKYPMLKIAYEIADSGNAFTSVYNAANEVAVQAFADEKISYFDIAKYTEEVLNYNWNSNLQTLEEIIEVDKEARIIANKLILKN